MSLPHIPDPPIQRSVYGVGFTLHSMLQNGIAIMNRTSEPRNWDLQAVRSQARGAKPHDTMRHRGRRYMAALGVAALLLNLDHAPCSDIPSRIR